MVRDRFSGSFDSVLAPTSLGLRSELVTFSVRFVSVAAIRTTCARSRQGENEKKRSRRYDCGERSAGRWPWWCSAWTISWGRRIRYEWSWRWRKSSTYRESWRPIRGADGTAGMRPTDPNTLGACGVVTCFVGVALAGEWRGGAV